MRNLSECRQEVFRRSEARIRQRRKVRTRVLACCIPLCLCIGAVWAVSLSGMFSATKDGAPPENFSDNSSIYTEVQVQSTDISHKHTDPETVTLIFDTIETAFATRDRGAGTQDFHYGSEMDDEETNRDMASVHPTETTPSYTITFSSEDGSQKSYTLSGNTLTDTSTGQRITLTEGEHAQLFDALGLTVTGKEDPE